MIVLTRKERDKQLRRSDILTAAERIFAQKGFHEATIQDIAREAQYATGTVYLYFKDKDSLYFSLVEEKMKNLLSIIEEQSGKASDAEDKIRIMLNEELDFFEKNKDFFRIFLTERAKPRAVKDNKFSRSPVILQYKGFVLGLMKLGQEQKIIRSDYSPGRIAEIYMAVLMSVVFDWFREGDKDAVHLKDLAGFIIDIFFNGAGKKR